MADHSTSDNRSAIQSRLHKSGAVLPSSAAPTLCGTGCTSNGQFQFGGLSELEMMRPSGETGRMSQRRLITRTLRAARRAAFLGLLLWLLPLLVFADSASFRFAWLSDTHVGFGSAEQDLRAAVRDINSLIGLSFVVLSGDVTEYGSREQLRLAKDLLDGLKIPSHVIPGNAGKATQLATLQ